MAEPGITIQTTGCSSSIGAEAIAFVSDLLRDTGLSYEETRSSPEPGARDSGLATGLAVYGAIQITIQTVLLVVAQFKSERSGYNVTLERGDHRVTFDSPDEATVRYLVAKLNTAPTESEESVTILIEPR